MSENDNGWSVFDMGEKRFTATNHRYAIECQGGTGLVAMVEGMGEKFRQRACLMAAAPELREALQMLLEDYLQISAMYQTNPDNGEWYEPQLAGVARAALAKATEANA